MKVKISFDGYAQHVDGAMLVLAMDQMIENDCGDSDMLSGCNRLYNWLLKHGCDREEGLEDW